MSEKETLKPCPFCGCEAEVRADDNGGFYVNCTKCFALIGYCTDIWGGRMTKSEAIATWNSYVEQES